MKIKNIILDLGGVLLNIDYSLTINSFKSLGITNFDVLFTQAQQSQMFNQFEKGGVGSDEFLVELNKFLPSSSKDEIIHAWNAMLLDFPKERFSFLLGLKEKYNTVLLSNTNPLHINYFHQQLKLVHRIDSLDDYFKNTYFSFEMGMRKPDPEIFLKVCELEGFNPKETLFIDDTLQHVEGAKLAGLNAFHLDIKSMDIVRLLDEIL